MTGIAQSASHTGVLTFEYYPGLFGLRESFSQTLWSWIMVGLVGTVGGWLYNMHAVQIIGWVLGRSDELDWGPGAGSAWFNAVGLPVLLTGRSSQSRRAGEVPREGGTNATPGGRVGSDLHSPGSLLPAPS